MSILFWNAIPTRLSILMMADSEVDSRPSINGKLIFIKWHNDALLFISNLMNAGMIVSRRVREWVEFINSVIVRRGSATCPEIIPRRSFRAFRPRSHWPGVSRKTYIFNVFDPSSSGEKGENYKRKQTLISNVISVPPNPLIVLYFGPQIFIYFCLFMENLFKLSWSIFIYLNIFKYILYL